MMPMRQFSELFRPIIETTYDTMCDVLNNPVLWSDHMIQKTLERAGGKPFNVEDVRLLVKDYLAVLCDFIRKEGRFSFTEGGFGESRGMGYEGKTAGFGSSTGFSEGRHGGGLSRF